MNTRKLSVLGAAGAAVAIFGSVLTATPAQAQVGVYYGSGPTIQADKNATRNIGIGLGAAAAYKLSQGKGKAALAFGAAAAIAGSRYEADRKAENATLVTRVDCIPVVAAVAPRWDAPCPERVRADVRVVVAREHIADWERPGNHGLDRFDARFPEHGRDNRGDRDPRDPWGRR